MAVARNSIGVCELWESVKIFVGHQPCTGSELNVRACESEPTLVWEEMGGSKCMLAVEEEPSGETRDLLRI